MEKQYIYIFSNSQYPEIVKVGKTNLHPEVRAKQLSSQTGSIGKWQVEWHIIVPDSEIAEKTAHYLLKEFREDPKKEFFKIRILEASKIIEKKFVEFFELKKTEIWQSESLKKAIRLIELKEKLSEQTKNLESELEIALIGLEIETKKLKEKIKI